MNDTVFILNLNFPLQVQGNPMKLARQVIVSFFICFAHFITNFALFFESVVRKNQDYVLWNMESQRLLFY